MADGNEIILFSYERSVFSGRMRNYLALRGIPYKACIQPAQMPRPDLARLGVNHRRIPIMAIGRDMYIDTRLQIETLEAMFAERKLGAGMDAAARGMAKLLESWTIEGGPFWKIATTMPLDAPILDDKKWMDDRSAGSGGAVTKENLIKGRPQALADVDGYFTLFENTFLADGRDWILGGKEGPTMADLHAVWVFDWAVLLATPASEFNAGNVVNEKRFPRVFAWVQRFRDAVEKAKGQFGAAGIIESEDAIKSILGSKAAGSEATVDEADPAKLKKGQVVEVCPTDFGFTHADKGTLVSLDVKKVVIEVKPVGDDGVLRLHFPRWGFKIDAAQDT